VHVITSLEKGINKEKYMKKQLSFLLLFLLSLTTTFAQVNPQRGYVITNQNDTISGTIDYLSDAKNAYEKQIRGL